LLGSELNAHRSEQILSLAWRTQSNIALDHIRIKFTQSLRADAGLLSVWTGSARAANPAHLGQALLQRCEAAMRITVAAAVVISTPPPTGKSVGCGGEHKSGAEDKCSGECDFS
jgi:hypothetical protein